MLQVENPVAKMPEFVDGIPVSAKEGHGIGVKSIIYYVEQLNGQCQFSVSDQLFILKIFIEPICIPVPLLVCKSRRLLYLRTFHGHNP